MGNESGGSFTRTFYLVSHLDSPDGLWFIDASGFGTPSVDKAEHFATAEAALRKLATKNWAQLVSYRPAIVRVDRTTVPGVTKRAIVSQHRIDATKPCVVGVMYSHLKTPNYASTDALTSWTATLERALVFNGLGDVLLALAARHDIRFVGAEMKVFNIRDETAELTVSDVLTVLK